MNICASLLLTLLSTAVSYKSYSGYQVLRTRDLKAEDVAKVAPLMDIPDFDFWVTPRVGRGAQIMASPYNITVLRNTLKRLDLQPQLLIEDVGVLVAEERANIEIMRSLEKSEGRAPILNRYLDFEEIQAYIDEVAAAFPEIVTILNIGTSTEGRPLRVVKISNGPGKNGIWFDSVMHAREWIGPPTVLYSINELTENLTNNQAILDANDFYFLPVANPDGFCYSWSDDRFWRKTRRPNPPATCVGTDPNRNFDHHWDEGGATPACSETFPGNAPFSEPECSAIADFLIANPSITFYVSVHSYGEYILYPWGHTTDLPPNADELEDIAWEASLAIRYAGGNLYDTGTAANVLYYAYGTGHDWVYEQAGIKLSYVVELPGGGSGGNAGFDPPASMIEPTCIELWAAYKVFASYIPASRR